MGASDSLPPEVFDIILSHLSDHSTRLPWQRKSDKMPSTSTLSACNLVNRRWHTRTTAKLYSSFHFHVEAAPISKLLMFLRTVMQNPDLGALVQRIEFKEHPKTHPVVSRDSAAELALQKDILRTLFTKKWTLNQTRRELEKAISMHELGPLVAVLMKYLPNVSAAFITSYSILKNKRDQLGALLEQPELLPNLETVIFAGNWDTPGPDIGSGMPTYSIFKSFDLPKIRRISIMETQLPSFVPRTFEVRHQSSNVEHLTITQQSKNQMSSGASYCLSIYPQLPKALVSFTLHVMNRDYFRPMVGSELLRSWLQTHKRSLKYLDVHNQDAEGKNLSKYPYIGLLNDFNCLQTLRIQPGFLVGLKTGVPGDASTVDFGLKDTLPPSLQSLTLYLNRHSDTTVPTLDAQLQDLVTNSPTDHPQFRHLLLLDRNKKRSMLGKRADYTHLPLYRECESNRVRLQIFRETVDLALGDADEPPVFRKAATRKRMRKEWEMHLYKERFLPPE